jgi:hypothetical protein
VLPTSWWRISARRDGPLGLGYGALKAGKRHHLCAISVSAGRSAEVNPAYDQIIQACAA